MTFLQFHWDTTPPKNDIPREGSWSMMSSHDHFVVICFFIFIIIAFLLRNTPLGFLWRWIKIFFIVMIVTLFADNIKKGIKEWWNKD